MAPYTGPEFPRLCAYQHVLGPGNKFDARDRPKLFDIKFLPFAEPDGEAVFAVTGGRDVFVCRPVWSEASDRNHPERCSLELITWIRDEDKNAWPNNSIAWAADPNIGEPLLCVGGSSVINVFEATDGKLVQHFIGHGGAVNDLVVSPLTPDVLVSASADKSIRVWRLSEKFKDQPCSHILAGAFGHKEEILALGLHRNGRYLLSGGHDCLVNLWVLPEFSNEDEVAKDPIQIQHPHFTSSEIHSDFIDCVQFYGDFVLSRCAMENKILLWSITGFSSRDPIPPTSAAPARSLKGRETRSAWATFSCVQRLLQFEAKDTFSFYMRFGLHHRPEDGHAMLAMGNLTNKLYFWDLTALEAGNGKRESEHTPTVTEGGVANRKKSTGSSAAKALLQRQSSTLSMSASSDGERRPGTPGPVAPPATDISLPFRSIKPHHTASISRVQFATRQVAWSNDGRWCVQVGEHGMICLYHRQSAAAMEYGE